MFPFHGEPYYRAYSILIDLTAVLIMAVILTTFIVLPKYSDKKIRRVFIAGLWCGLIAGVLDIWSYALMSRAETVRLFYVVTEIDVIFAIAFFMLTSDVVTSYLSMNGKVKPALRFAMHSAMALGMLMHAIPPVHDMIFVTTADAQIENGPLAPIYFGLMIFAVLASDYMIFANRKMLGTKVTVLTLTLRTLPLVIFAFLQDEEPPIMLASALFLLVSYIFAIQQLFDHLLQNEKQLARQQIELADMKTKVMLSQVKPHFVYNALSSIAFLCKEDPERAKQLTLDFSRYLRGNLDTLNDETFSAVPFSEELEHIKSYLNIEQARFRDRLTVVYDIGTVDFQVPALSIQPIVENAVKHGICNREDGGTLTISCQESDDGYLITVADNGVGFDTEAESRDGKNHIGIPNAQKRIDLAGGSFEIRSTPGVGTTAVVRIPKREE